MSYSHSDKLVITRKIYHHDITDISLKVALSTINQLKPTNKICGKNLLFLTFLSIIYNNAITISDLIYIDSGTRVAQWVRSLDLTTHTSLSPMRRGFAPSFVNSVTNLHKLSDQYHWVLWNTHHTKLTFVTPIDKLSSFLLIFELFSLIFYWKYSIFLHETPHTWNMTWHIFWRHWRMSESCLFTEEIGTCMRCWERVIFHFW
jgi:hypothetical protein